MDRMRGVYFRDRACFCLKLSPLIEKIGLDLLSINAHKHTSLLHFNTSDTETYD